MSCCITDCKNLARYGLRGLGVADHCRDHRLEGHVKIPRLCLVCKNTYAQFGEVGSSVPTHCSMHHPEHYINVLAVRKRCLKCNKTARFNINGSAVPLYCTAHHLEITCLNQLTTAVK